MNTLLDLIGALLYIAVFPIIVLVNCCIELIAALKYIKTSTPKIFILLLRHVQVIPSFLKQKLDIGKLIPWKAFHR